LTWLIIDGYEDEPAAFGVPPYIGFHVRYVCGVLELRGIDYRYLTIDHLRHSQKLDFSDVEGIVLVAGAIVPGKYLRGTPISCKEACDLIAEAPKHLPFLAGGWAIRGWKQKGRLPFRENLFFAVQDIDASLNQFLGTGFFKQQRRTNDEWNKWAIAGASSRSVRNHPDIGGPLIYEIEVYQGCVRYKRGCRFCIEPKKGMPIWRTPKDVIEEASVALDHGVKHIRLGGMTDVYTYMAEGIQELEYPIPNPEPIAELLYSLRDDERLDILHVDNANPSIISEHIEPSTEITKTLVETLSDGAVLSFGLESVDPTVHELNWLNCNSDQLLTAIRHVNQYGRKRGKRGLPQLLPGLNFIAGLNGETSHSYNLNRTFLQSLVDEGLWLRRINIRQVEGEGFQEVNKSDFDEFKTFVRKAVDSSLVREMFPIGQRLNHVHWESHNSRTRLPDHVHLHKHKDPMIHGKGGITFGRQIGAYPLLVGVPYLIPLETASDVLVTGHGSRSLTGVEIGIRCEHVSEKQLASIPGIGAKSAWRLVSERAKAVASNSSISDIKEWFDLANLDIPELARLVLEDWT